ncbi:hypothetical protein E1B28_000850 [Marasmius oreades]|uniref:Uncharacterized protein n=1 Tax=Marasmius oreades TaxID=181124 RepID=A0A9P7V2E6_9AGAR|nr:uncharacterized protein E1B28_000850 [Marasmius oreades]KAG7098962.1 hypothetical protein E1B28_000850 [Marasmius oreades]
MSTLSPRHESSSRNWWALAKSSSNPSFHSDKSSSRDKKKFNTIASAIGLSKSKKHPSLTIQSPPPAILSVKSHSSPLTRPQSPPNQHQPKRPPSKSVSSTSDSIEPRTPSDPRDSGSQRHSLLTLSDTDPFAARNISLASPSESSRLSAYSGSSIPDYHVQPKKSDAQPPIDRHSYASSSPQSYLHPAEDISLPNGPSWISELPNYSSLKSDENPTIDDRVWDQLYDPASMDILIKSSSSTTLTDHNRLSYPDRENFSSSRPPVRARGMTVGIVAQRSKFLHDERELKPPSPKVNPPPTSFNHRDPTSPSPRVIVRQPSLQRMGLPVTAPPSQKLPPPPLANDQLEDRPATPRRTRRDSVSSIFSSLSRDTGMHNQHYIPRSKTRDGTSLTSEERADSSMMLKRAVSQQSLKGTITPSKTDTSVEKVPKKQRSFHQIRVPVPPMPTPLRHTSTSTHEGPQVTESKRDSLSNSNNPPNPVRKRLFSGSSMRRPSTSQFTVPEDDTRSVFSIPIETDYVSRASRKSTGPAQQSIQVSSFWDEVDPPSSPQPSLMDYTPMQIMSPAEMLKLEASVQESMEVTRSRGLSIASASSTFTSESEHTPSIMSVTSQSLGISLTSNPPGPSRSHSMLVPRNEDSISCTSVRPSTSQGSPMVGLKSCNDCSTNEPSPNPSEVVSLSPPPRPRRKTHHPPLVDHSRQINDFPTMVSLPPPPRSRSKSLRSNASASLKSTPTAMTTPPVMSMTRKSIVKKPSFLHIDDDQVDHTRATKAPEPQLRASIIFKHEDSFLDFARDSLDTLQSDE